jgi:hypothetical protein
MDRIPKDKEREDRISNEAVVDCYNEYERALGWYYYLEGKMQFPFEATCIKELRKSRMKSGEQVTVTGMAGEDECENNMWVEVSKGKDSFIVPLEQLSPLDPDDEDTFEAVEDWQYWRNRGYKF